MTRSRPVLATLLLLSLSAPVSAAMGPESCTSCPGMTWVKTECRFFYLIGTEPRVVHSIAELPQAVTVTVDDHLAKRLGRPFMSKLQFYEAHVYDLDTYYKHNPTSNRDENRLPRYELAFRVMFYSQEPVEYCATVQLDSAGAVLKDIDLPDVRRYPERGEVVPLQDILNLAHSLGVPTEKATLDMRYEKKSGCLEYIVSYGPPDPTPEYNLIMLYIKAHDPKDYSWFKTALVSYCDPDGRPNNGSQPPVGAPSVRASCSIRPLRAACG
jgi:hypothetical protein